MLEPPSRKNNTCANCGIKPSELKESGKRMLSCGLCFRNSYCGKECQKAHWKLSHKDHPSSRRIHPTASDALSAQPKGNQINRDQTTDEGPQHTSPALQIFMTENGQEIADFLRAVHFPLSKTKACHTLLIRLQIQWDPSVKGSLRDQFKLVDGYVTTWDDLTTDFSNQPELLTIFKAAEIEDEEHFRRFEQNSAKSKQRRPSRVAWVATRRVPSGEPHVQGTLVLQDGRLGLTASANDPRNAALPWVSAIRKSLTLPPVPTSRMAPNTERLALIRLLEVYSEMDVSFLERSREAQWALRVDKMQMLNEAEISAGDEDGGGRLDLWRNRRSYGYLFMYND